MGYCKYVLPLSESSLSEESLLSEDEEPVFIFVRSVVSRDFSATTKRIRKTLSHVKDKHR